MLALLENLLSLVERNWQYGDFIRIKPDAEVSLSYETEEVPQEWVKDDGLWAVDAYERESGTLNICRVEDPHPGAFCSWVHESDVTELVSTRKGRSVRESTIDFPQSSLDMAIWDKTNDSYKIKPSVKKIILDTLKKYTKINLEEMADEIHVTGSSGTNQYLSDTDLDIHLVVDENKIDNSAAVQGEVFKFFRQDENIVHIGQHPIEVYLQFNPKQELLSEALYNLLTDKWIIGPKILPESYDPYDDFSDVLDDVKELAEEADEELGELRRDMVDYDTIGGAIENLSGDSQQRLLTKLRDKLYEIESDIETLKRIKLSWINLRRESSKPVSEEEALKDVKVAKRWRDANAIFKFLSRYKYIRVISKLEQMLDDNKLEPDELNVIRQMMGVER